ncbi:hypothetical protein EHV15_04280 [Paenibacillus oralis]|uniref:Uncharacterized protein n=1 Tax=Paenibacillus oralis TaxID=2490856 RepID=A0A3P3U159_9BACL|nr:hypothetical protein [Paenibacillus oralis]RRJ62253.1 hypothetical protein EHV15_04280 [Paenibacillus oralis]
MLALLLLSACNSTQGQSSGEAGAGNSGAAATAEADTSGNSSSDTSAAGQQAGPGGGQMDEGQMKMMRTFRSLIRMDEQEGLEITKAQAESMLPIVQEAVTASELTDDNEAGITALLTEQQQAYLTESASQMGGRGARGQAPSGDAGQGAPGAGQTGASDQAAAGTEGAAGSEAGTPPENGGQPTTPPQGDGQAPAGDGQDAAEPAGRSGGMGQGDTGPGGPGGIADAGEQLIELLQSKTTAAE